MFDFGQIVERVSGLFEPGVAVPELLGGSLADLVEAANFDPSILEAAPVDQLRDLLMRAGIDPGNLADAEILETAQDLLRSGVVEHLDLSKSS